MTGEKQVTGACDERVARDAGTSHVVLYKLYRLYKPNSSSRSRELFIKEYTALGIFKNIHYGRIPQGLGKNTRKPTTLPHSPARAYLSALKSLLLGG